MKIDFGIKVYADATIPKTKRSYFQERKWVRRLGFEKWRRFDFVESMVIVFHEGNIFVHPDNFDSVLSVMGRSE